MGFFQFPAQGYVLNSQKDLLCAYVFPIYLAGIEQHDFLTDVLESMSNLEVVKRFFFGKDFFQQLPKFGDVPLFVSQVIDETSDRLAGSYFKGFVKVAVRREYLQIRIQDQKGFSNSFHNTFGIATGILVRKLRRYT